MIFFQTFFFKIKVSLIILVIFLLTFCKPSPNSNKDFSKENADLPTQAVIRSIVSNSTEQAKINQAAKEKGYSSVVEWYSNIIQSISPEELDFYYQSHKPKLGEGSSDFISSFRKEIHDRLTWKKIFAQAGIDYSKALTSVDISVFQPSLESQFLGSKNPKLQIIEFADFACYYCAKFQDVKKKILIKHGNQIQWIFKNFPLISRHDEAFLAHIALGCVEKVEPKKYWDYYFRLFENYRNLEKEKLLEYAKQSKIPIQEWKSCMNDKAQKEAIIAKIEQDIEEGKRLGVTGTPSFWIEGKLHVGAMPYSAFESLILKHLKK